MADPEGYAPQYDFSAYQATNPSKPLPGHELDVELLNVATAVGQTNTALSDIRRPDGKLQNGIVTPESTAPGFIESIVGLANGALEVIDGYGAELTHFSQTWLGAQAEDPVAGLAGAPLYVGQMYYNTVAGEYRAYDGATWQFHTGVTQIDTYSFVAASGQTTFSGVDGTGQIVAVATGALMVTVNGIGPMLEGTDYEVTAGGDGITFTVGRTLNDRVQITSFRQINIANVAPQVAADADRAEAALGDVEAAAASASSAASAAAASALAIGGRFFASEAAFTAAPVDPLVDMVFVRNGNDIIPYAREPGAADAEDIQHPDGSDWAKSGMTNTDVAAAITAALASAVSRSELLASGTFNPTITFATPGTVSVTYGAVRRGAWRRFDKSIEIDIDIDSATITKGTGSGRLRIGFGSAEFAPGEPITPGALSLGGGVIVFKNNAIRPPTGTVRMGVTIQPGEAWAELTHELFNSQTQYISDTHVFDGAITIKLKLWFTVD